jgi:hypothetical protein
MANPGPASTVSNHPSNLSTIQANRLLAVYKGVSTAAAADFALPIVNSTTYSVQQIVVTNANNAGATADVSSVKFGLYTASAQGGTAIYTSAALTGVTSSSVVSVITPTTTALQTAQTVYANISTPFVTATVDVYVYGYDLS